METNAHSPIELFNRSATGNYGWLRLKEDNGLNAFLNYFFLLRQNQHSQKVLNFLDVFFFAVLNRSAGIPKAKPHDVTTTEKYNSARCAVLSLKGTSTRTPKICIFNDQKQLPLHTLHAPTCTFHFHALLSEITKWNNRIRIPEFRFILYISILFKAV